MGNCTASQKPPYLDDDFWGAAGLEGTMSPERNKRRRRRRREDSAASSSPLSSAASAPAGGSEREIKVKIKREGGGAAFSAASVVATVAGGSASSDIKIKIRMKKRELEELLRRAAEGEGNEGPARPLLQRVLAGRRRAVRVGWGGGREGQERHWKPMLQTIPELPD